MGQRQTELGTFMGGAMAAVVVGMGASIAAPPDVSPAPPPSTPTPGEGREPDRPWLVNVEVLADTTRIEPGKPFDLAIAFKIRDGWHIYWQNPGDNAAGATEATIKAPDGFKVGPVRYPGPRRFDLPGDIVSYGYVDEVILFATVTPPVESDPGTTYRFDVEATWLACAETCIPGHGNAFVTLEAGTERHPAAKANEARFTPFRARLPMNANRLQGARAEWRDPVMRPTLAITVKDVEELEFFPASREAMTYLGREVQYGNEEGTIALKYEFTPKPMVQPFAAGVLMVRRGQAVGYYDLMVNWKQGLPVPVEPGGG